ncbi:MAG: DUF3971 domain-containing protein [Roseiarcus sp.]
MQRLLLSGQGRTLPCSWRAVAARRCGGVLLGLCALAVVVTSVAIGGFLLLLALGPINVESLNPRIAQSLEERLGARYAVAIGPTYLMSMKGGVGLGFGGIVIRDRAGRVVLSAPSGRVGLDALSLLGLQVKVRRLELDGLDLRLRLRPDGALSIAAAADPTAATIELPAPAPSQSEPTSAAPDFGLVAFRIIDAMTGASQALDRVELTRGHLELENEALGKKTVYDDLLLSFDKKQDAATIRVSARGPAGRWSVDATAVGGDAREVSLAARDLSLDDVLLMHASHLPFDADMPISFKIDARLAANSAIQALQGRFALGAGYFKLDDPDHEPFLVDEATGDIAWDAAARRYRFSNLQLLSGATHIFAAGWLAPPTQAQAAWLSHFESDDTVFAPERPGEKPIVFDQAVFDARFVPQESRFVLDRLAIHGPNVNGAASGETVAVDGGTTLKLNFQVGPSAVVDILRLWPSFINADARAWCLEHIRGGQVVAGSMNVDWDAAAFDAAAHKRAVPRDSVHGEFSTRGTVVDLLPGIPALTGLDASGVITGRDFTAGAKSGVIELSPSRRIQVADISYFVPDTTPAPIVPARAGARLQGGADALADLLNRDALKRYAGLSVDPATVKGQFEGNLALDLKLGKTVRPEDNQFRADGTLTNFRVDKFLASERLEQASLSVLAEHGNLKIAGQGQMYGVPVAVDLTKGAADEGSVALSLSLDNAARAKLGFPAAAMLNGAMGVRIKAPLSKSSAEIEVDLTHVAIESPQTGTLKAAGKPGKATFSLKPDADGQDVAVNAIAVDAGSVAIRGTAELAADGAFKSAKLTQLRLSPADELKADIQNGETAVKATVRGAALDARGLVKGFLGAGGPSSGGGKDIDLDVKIANVIGANSQSLGQFELIGAWRGGAMRTMQAKARIGEGALTAQQDESGRLHAHATDAGALIKFFDFYGRMEGGTLDLAMQDAEDGSRGSANVTNFVLRNEPALRQLVAAGQAPVGGRIRMEQAPIVNPDTARFEKMSASFTRATGRLDLREAVIFNSQMGLTTQGFIDYGRDRVDLNGTFVPAYQVNSLVTHIPVVGTLLGGGTHEGIFGVNYRIVGPASGPTLNVNPLSAMTPGFLRKVFGAIDGTTPALGAPSQTDAPLQIGESPPAVR